MKHASLFLLFHLIMIVNELRAQQLPDLSDKKKLRIDSLLQHAAAHDLFTGGVLVAENGQIIYENAAGYADAAAKAQNSTSTCFNAASVTKPFTSLAVLQLVQGGKCRLSDPVKNYLTDFPYPDITIRHLLSHTGGLPQKEKFMHEFVAANRNYELTSREAYDGMLALGGQRKFPPGEKWDYSNIGYCSLALMVEKISGQPFERYVEEKIFRLAGMSSSFVRCRPGAVKPGCARRYILPNMFDQYYKPVDSLASTKVRTHAELGGTCGDGNLFTTLRDLALFDRALYTGLLLDTGLLREAFTPTTLNNGKKHNYGLGWNIVYNQFGDTIVYHDGHVPGASAMLLRNITRKQAILVYENYDSRTPGAFFLKINNISHFINGRGGKKLNTRQSLIRAYGEALVTKGPDHAAATFNKLKGDTANYYLDEMEMNDLGYNLMYQAGFDNSIQMACEVFKLMTMIFHKSANAYDSYAEALALADKKEEAILMYQRSISMNPGNAEGKKRMEKLMRP